MRARGRELRRWRKKTPSKHRSYAEKRSRMDKYIHDEIEKYKGK